MNSSFIALSNKPASNRLIPRDRGLVFASARFQKSSSSFERFTSNNHSRTARRSDKPMSDSVQNHARHKVTRSVGGNFTGLLTLLCRMNSHPSPEETFPWQDWPALPS